MGNPDINCLQCIVIFGADWQLLLKYHSSYGFLPQTEAAGTLVHAQGGGRKGHSAIDRATQQIVETEISHLNQRSALNLYLDLRMCFDLMVEACHNLACRCHGAVDEYLHLHACTHQLMCYYVQHKFGVSSEFNTFSQHPWHGAGQGAANTALRYIVLSDTLINAYHTKIALQLLHDPAHLIEVIRSLKAFIDNVVLHATSHPNTTLEDLQHQAQERIRWWDKLVKATGGELNPKKCCGLLYMWSPDSQGILQLRQPEPPLTLISISQTHDQQIITILKNNESTCYLGIYITADRNMQPMENHLWKKALLYTSAFHRTPMT